MLNFWIIKYKIFQSSVLTRMNGVLVQNDEFLLESWTQFESLRYIQLSSDVVKQDKKASKVSKSSFFLMELFFTSDSS